MTRHRRVEITVFRRRVLITSAGASPEQSEGEVTILGGCSEDTILAYSEEGREIIAETVRLLEQKLTEISQSAETQSGTDDRSNPPSLHRSVEN